MIKNLIFDVGGVLIGYRWKEMLMEHGLSEEETVQLANKIFVQDLWTKQVDMGILSIEDAIEQLGRRHPEYAETIAWFLRNAEQMAVPRPEVWDRVAALKGQGYRIYILSNYSEELFCKHTAGASFLEIMDGGVVSYQVHCVKPDEGIYRALLEKYGLLAEECLFYDDREENVWAAERLGMQGFHVQSEELLNRALDDRRMRATTLCYIERDGKYLMLCRSPKKQDGSAGKWLGIGGKIEFGESPDECILREVYEETGLKLTSYRQRGILYYYSDTWEDEIMYLYSADGFTGELSAVCEEGELRWVPVEEVMELRLWEGDRIFLKKLMDGESDIRLALTYEGDTLVGCEEKGCFP